MFTIYADSCLAFGGAYPGPVERFVAPHMPWNSYVLNIKGTNILEMTSMNSYRSRTPAVMAALKSQNLISSGGMVKSLSKAMKLLISEGFYAVASLPTADKPPSNLASMVKQCEAKGRKDLGEKILAQWSKVLDKYPHARLNWAAASTIGGASIKKNVFGGVEFVDWLSAKLKLEPEEAASLPSIPVVELAPNTPALAIPKVGETPEDWKDAAAETAAMLKNAEKAFKHVDEFLEYLNKEIGDLERKVSEYGPGGKKHLLKSGEPHSMAQRVPKWEAQLKAYSAKLKETTTIVSGAEKKFTEAAESYSVAPVTTVEFESKAQESLTDVLSFILDIKDIKKQKQLLGKFKESLERMENDKVAANVSASVVMAEGVGTFIESLWDKVRGFWDSVIKWCFGLSDAVDSFYDVAHMVETTATAKTITAKRGRDEIYKYALEGVGKSKKASAIATLEIADNSHLYTGKELMQAWPKVTYHGKNLLDKHTGMADEAMERLKSSTEVNDLQECYGGYSPSKDVFMVGFDVWGIDDGKESNGYGYVIFSGDGERFVNSSVITGNKMFYANFSKDIKAIKTKYGIFDYRLD